MEPMTVNMCLKFVLFGFLLGVSIGSANSSCFDSFTDLCDADLPDIPYLATRDPTVMVTNVTFNWKFCDVYAINTSMWYKSKTPMSTSCPSMFMCGTKFPIWMDGQNPDTLDGLVNRTSCLRDFDSCCLHTYKLAAINCGEFMAYCFVDLPSNCHQRYCFDVKKSEPNTDITHTPTILQTEAELSNVSSTKKTQPSTSTDGATQTIIATTDLYVSTFGINTSTISVPETDQSTHYTTTAKTNVKELETDDESEITILLACTGLMAATIVVLVTVIIRRKRMSKVTDKMMKDKSLADEDKPYETLRKPEVSVIKANASEGFYRVISYEHHVDAVRGGTNPGYDTLNNNDYTIAEHDEGTLNTEKELYEEEDRYVTLP